MKKYITDEQKSQIPLIEGLEKFSLRKHLALSIADLYDQTPLDRYASKIRGCGDQIIFRRYEGGEREIAYSLFCGSRLCPICGQRRSLKAFAQLSQCLDFIDEQRAGEKKQPLIPLLITLTIENVKGDALPEAIQRINDGYSRLNRTGAWTAIKGAWRTLEITINKEANTFHPHLHVFALVNKSYFTSADYISQDKLALLWQRAAKLPYKPIVDIRRVGAAGGGKAEVSKYITKQMDMLCDVPLQQAIDALIYLHEALDSRKQYITYGVIRKAQRALNLSDEDGQLLDPTEGDEELLAQLRPDTMYWYELMRYNSAYAAYEAYSLDPLSPSFHNPFLNPAEKYMAVKYRAMVEELNSAYDD